MGGVDTYPIPAHGWTCFHCGETFTTIGAARDHFGATPENQAGCLIDRVALEEGGKPERGRGLLLALRKTQDELAKLQPLSPTQRERLEALATRVIAGTSPGSYARGTCETVLEILCEP